MRSQHRQRGWRLCQHLALARMAEEAGVEVGEEEQRSLPSRVFVVLCPGPALVQGRTGRGRGTVGGCSGSQCRV